MTGSFLKTVYTRNVYLSIILVQKVRPGLSFSLVWNKYKWNKKKWLSSCSQIQKLCDRVASSTLLEDRRDAVRALKSLSKVNYEDKVIGKHFHASSLGTPWWSITSLIYQSCDKSSLQEVCFVLSLFKLRKRLNCMIILIILWCSLILIQIK